mmetsp:Transcript_29818/g.88514  ORF Transcript_29818/g.88514 Transcript_29818/m.88514 type:complete len:157 (-) Transcript_29818:2262-2732(-)
MLCNVINRGPFIPIWEGVIGRGEGRLGRRLGGVFQGEVDKAVGDGESDGRGLTWKGRLVHGGGGDGRCCWLAAAVSALLLGHDSAELSLGLGEIVDDDEPAGQEVQATTGEGVGGVAAEGATIVELLDLMLGQLKGDLEDGVLRNGGSSACFDGRG